jgi:hypothetical protein
MTTKQKRRGKKKSPRRARSRPDSQLSKRMEEQGYLMCSRVAERVGVHNSTVYKWIRDDVIEYVDHNGAYYVLWSSVVKHMGKVGEILGLEAG